MRTLKHQKGLSTLGWLIVLMIGGFFITCAFKLTPAYFENTYVKTALTGLDNVDGALENLSNSDIRKQLGNFFTLNNVRNQEVIKSVKIDHQRDRLVVTMNYEIRVPLFSNIDVVMRFNNEWDSSRPDECCKPESE